jgi:hypothetical protein
MSKLASICLFPVLMIALLRPVLGAERLALLIGNESYNDKVGGLHNPLNDIKLVGDALEKLDFKTTRIPNASFDALQKAVRAHVAKVRAAGDGAISFVYYSGHGASNADTGLNYLIPVDVPDADDVSLWSNSVELKSDIIDKLGDQAPAASHFVVFDACRNELKLKNKDMKAIAIDGQGFVPIQRSRFLIAYSTAAKRTASDQGAGSGAYARILAEELVSPGFEAATMFRKVQLRVQTSILQFPYSSIDGMPEIYLAGKDGLASAKPAEQPTLPKADIVAFERERESEKNAMQTLLQQIGDAGTPAGGAFNKVTKWSKQSLVVCFLDGSLTRRTYVARVARQWTVYGKIDFDFGSWDNPRSCAAGVKHDVAVSFEGSGNWAYVGAEATAATDGNQPTVVLGSVGLAQDDDLRAGKYNREILHEFGHVLGFDHNLKAPAGGVSCDGEFDWDLVYAEFEQRGLSREQVDQILRGQPSQKYIIGAFDKNSVMNYDLPASYFLRGLDSPCYATPLNDLSLRDKLAMFKIYQ